MPRTAVTQVPLVAGGSSVPSPVAVDQANGMTIVGAEPERTILVVSNTAGSALNVTVAASSTNLGLGNFPATVVSIPAGATRYVGPFESARVQQPDRSMSVDFQTGFTGTIGALYIPRGVL